MIAFATLLLGLIVGPQPVEFLAGDAVASVEILLDGRQVARLEQPPWETVCDFGARLEPHELVAVAYDRDGKEIGRTRQWINLPRSAAEASIALGGGRDGKNFVAHLTWESTAGEEPESVTATFDGHLLPVADLRRIELPPFDPDQLHHLRVELDFRGNVSSVVEATFAGTYVDRINTELTAVPVLLGKRSSEPAVAGLAGRFSRDERPLTVRAIEKGPAELVLVRDESARGDLNHLLRHDQETLWRRAKGGSTRDRGSARVRIPLPDDLKVRFLWPVSDRRERSGYTLDVFPPSREFTDEDGGLFWILTYVRRPYTVSREVRYGDALAAAGLVAAGRNRRRAVVFLAGEDVAGEDASQFDLEETADYLSTLGVPLFVWSTAPDSARGYTADRIVDVSTLDKLRDAVRELLTHLERQRVVWLDGTHPPQEIVLESNRLGIQLVR